MILAGGHSRRFGDDKLTTELDGQPLVAHVIRAVQAAEQAGTVRASWIVVPEGDTGVGRIARSLGVRVVATPNAHRGMGWSIRAGMEAVAASAPAGPAAVLVMLGDQPGVRPDVMAAVVRRWRVTGAALVRPRYARDPGTPGHPVLVDRSRWGELRALEGDHGLGALAGSCELVDVPGRNSDIDTRQDLADFMERDEG